MSYSTKKLVKATEKDLLCVVEAAEIITDWTNVSANINYAVFPLSNVHLEYVTKVTVGSTSLTEASSYPPSVNEFYWDWDSRKLYVNNSVASMTVVFFELHFATKSFFAYRDPMDSNTTEMFYAPRIPSNGVSIPSINKDDIQLFGTSSGSISLINSDGSFYLYSGFNNKTIKLYHLIDGTDNIKYIYKGRVESFSIDDNSLKLQFRSFDHVFNSTYISKGDERNSYFYDILNENVDPNSFGFPLRAVYGVVDDFIPINLDWAETPLTTNNRKWFCRCDYHDHALTLTTEASTTSSKLYVGSNHYAQIGDSVYCDSLTEASWVSGVGSDYIDISPAFTTNPGVGIEITRSTIGYITIKDNEGNFFNLKFGIDYIEQAPQIGIGLTGYVGFKLADNFEANHTGLTIFDPNAMSIYCRVYGIKHATTNDSTLGNLTDSSLILIDLFENAGLTTDDYDETEILALTESRPLCFSIPEDVSLELPRYRDIILKINQSVLGNIYINDDNKISYKYVIPLDSSSYTVDSSKILRGSFNVNYESSEIYSFYKVYYARKENSNGSGRFSHSYEHETSDIARFLHEVSRVFDIETYLYFEDDAEEIVNRYMIFFEDWQKLISFAVKTQLIENSVGETITIEREKLIGYNYVKRTNRSITAVLSTMQKSIDGVKVTSNAQTNLENNSGDW